MSGIWSFQRGELWGIDLTKGPSVGTLSPKIPVRFTEAGAAAQDELAEAMGLPSPNLIIQRFERGGRCFALWSEERMASYCWVAQGVEWIGEMEIHFRMQPGDRYIWDCFTLPEYRRRGLYSALLNRMVKALEGEGLTRIWIGSNLENQPSIKGFENAGFQPAVQIWFTRILSLRCFWMRAYPSAPTDLVSAARGAFSSDQALRIDPLIIYARAQVNASL